MSQVAAMPTPAAIPSTRPAISSPRRREPGRRRKAAWRREAAWRLGEAWAGSVSVSDTALVTQPNRLAVRSFAESSASGQAQVTGDQALGMRYGTVKVTLAARPVCCLKLTGITVAW
jgi:hypothetical protein